MAQQNDFDFNAFNALVNNKPAGLKVFLAQQLMANALWTLEQYDNPRATEAQGILGDIKALRQLMKDDAAARAARNAS